MECSTSIIEKRLDDGIFRYYAVEGFNSIWGYLKSAALKAGVIAPGQRVTLQGLKRRGVTDTKG